MSEERSMDVVRIEAGAAEARRDRLAEEEPLEIRIRGVPIAVVMRTPGHDEDLVRGFLVTERVVDEAAHVVSIRHCSTAVDPEAEENVIDVVLREDLAPPLERLRRNLYASSSCGVCGKATIESALSRGGKVESNLVHTSAMIASFAKKLRTAQPGFDSTGGLHAAALFDRAGAMLVAREDVGRHNAVDKVVGAALVEGLRGGDLALFVSGRVGFEIVQKAAAFGVPIVAGVSAPSSLAVRFGSELGVTVVGFVRGESMNVYSYPGRVTVG